MSSSKGERFLEKLSRADAFVLDKTGTHTKLTPQMRGVVLFGDNEMRYMLRYATYAEQFLAHPWHRWRSSMRPKKGISMRRKTMKWSTFWRTAPSPRGAWREDHGGQSALHPG
jgi:hypothetical protein